jgi:2-desacetyl-2-hydroxyethyl bacteriochlorophyllide A dehydrogenase
MKSLYLDADLTRILFTKALSVFWKNVPLSGFSPVCYAEMAEPGLPGPNWVKIKNKMCGICATDVHLMFLEMSPKASFVAVPPVGRVFFGHEVVGEVTETGAGVRDLSYADRVVLRYHMPNCYNRELYPKCPMCRNGDYLLCANVVPGGGLPDNRGGGFSPVMVAHESQAVKIDDDISDSEAVMIEPYACAVRAVLKQIPHDGDKVLVIGAGTIGLCIIASLCAISPRADIYAISRYPHQATMAERLGAKEVIPEKDAYRKVARVTEGRYIREMFNNENVIGGFDIVYDSVGSDKTVKDALRWTRGGGTVVLVGANFAPEHLDYSPIIFQEVRLIGSNSHGMEEDFRGKRAGTFETVLALHKEGKIDLSGFVTHTFPVDDYREAIGVFFNKKNDKSIKVALVHA